MEILALLLTLAVAPAEPTPDPLGRGFLGVTVTSGTLTVSGVSPGTPAELAGFQPGDEFVRIGEVAFTDFPQVTAHLKSFRPGSRLTIVVRRGTGEKTLTAKLTARPASADYYSEPFPP